MYMQIKSKGVGEMARIVRGASAASLGQGSPTTSSASASVTGRQEIQERMAISVYEGTKTQE
jgi:hypothetical protein